MTLDERISELTRAYRPLAIEILKETIRVPADYVDKPVDEGGDPLCGTSNHEGPRMELLRRAVVELAAVRRPEDVAFDAYGNLVWSVEDPSDGTEHVAVVAETERTDPQERKRLRLAVRRRVDRPAGRSRRGWSLLPGPRSSGGCR